MPWLDEKSPGPFSGVKVIDMSNVVFGPFGSQILGDLGADIIKIEKGGGRFAALCQAIPFHPPYLTRSFGHRTG